MEKYLNYAKAFYYEKIRKPVSKPSDGLLNQIRETSRRLENAYCRFENASDDDLLDSVIYEIQSLKALYRYLIKRAKENGVESGEISVFEREAIQ